MKKNLHLLPLIFGFLLIFSCGKNNPTGTFTGSVKDWVHEVFEGSIISNGEEGKISLVLRQTPDGLFSRMKFEHPKINTVEREGTWDIGDGERIISFSDNKEPSEYFLIKRGARFAFQTKQGLTNDDGSPVLLMRNQGLSRKASYPLKFSFTSDRKVIVKGGGENARMDGQWEWSGSKVVVSAKLSMDEKALLDEQEVETYKYFLEWDSEASEDLLLEKMVILRPFRTKSGVKRQSWMSSLIFSEKPRLVSK